MHRLSLAAAIAAGVLVAIPTSAQAGGGGGAYTEIIIHPGPSSGAYTDGSGAGSNVSNDDERKSSGGRRRSSPTRCSYEYLEQGDQASAERIWGPSPGGPGNWGRKICHDDEGRSSATIVWLPRRANPPAMAQSAERYLALPTPVVSSSPSADELLIVGLDTWLWVDPSTWRPMTSTVSVPGVSVTVTAVPERVVWQMGDGTTVVCPGPGRAYDPAVAEEQQHTDCSHRYATTSVRERVQVYEITATTEWRVTWSASGAPGGGDLGVVRRSSPPVAVRVGEVQAVNVRPKEGR